MIRLSQLLGQPAVALDRAERAGTVRGVALVDGRIAAVSIDSLVVPASAVRSFEGDALTFDSFTPVPEELRRRIDRVIGRPVLTSAGDLVGTLVDLDLDERGVVEAIELDGRTLPGSRLGAVGTYVVIVSTEPEAGIALPPPAPPP